MHSCSDKSKIKDNDLIQVVHDILEKCDGITTLELVYDFFTWLRFPHSVHFLRLSDNNLSSKDAAKLFHYLKSHSKNKFESINLSLNNIDDDCVKDLGELIASRSSLKEIDVTAKSFSKISISENGLKDLVKYLSGNTSLRVFNLSGHNCWSNECIIQVITLIRATRICHVLPEHYDYEYPEGLLLPLITNRLMNQESTLNLSLK